MKYTIMILVLLISCQGEEDDKFTHLCTQEILAPLGLERISDRQKYSGVDPLLQPYVQIFEDRFNLTIDYPVNFTRLEDGTAAKCIVYTTGQKEIFVDTKQYEETKQWWHLEEQELIVEYTIAHELGHCEFGRGHKKGKTFMRAILREEQIINLMENHKEQMYIELHRNRATPPQETMSRTVDVILPSVDL